MKTLNMKKLTIAAVAALTVAGIVSLADACSRIVCSTTWHGVVVSRTLDWSETLGEIAEVSVIGPRSKSGHYKNPAKWTVKYQTLSFVEPEVFENTTSEAINTVGLAASVLYMADSEKLQQTHKDNGAPAVNLNNLVSFLVENYATVQEALDAHAAGKWQAAWAETIHVEGDAIHGLHFSLQDKTGHIALFQFTDVGEVIYDNRKGDEDIRVMTNDPLLWKQRVMQEYVGKNNIRRMDADVTERTLLAGEDGAVIGITPDVKQSHRVPVGETDRKAGCGMWRTELCGVQQSNTLYSRLTVPLDAT